MFLLSTEIYVLPVWNIDWKSKLERTMISQNLWPFFSLNDSHKYGFNALTS